MSTTNEYTILMRLLTRPGNPMGAGVEDLLDALGLPEDVGRQILFQRMAGLQNQLRPLGLEVRYNSVSHVFYVDTRVSISGEVAEGALPERLAATLLVVITLTYREGKWVSLDDVRALRRKAARGLMDDVRELVSLGYLELDASKKKVRPGSRVGFEIDLEGFLKRLGES